MRPKILNNLKKISGFLISKKKIPSLYKRKNLKILLFFFLLFQFYLPVSAIDFNFRAEPSYIFLQKNDFKSTFTMNAALDFAPLTLRTADKAYLSLGGQFFSLQEEGISSHSLFDGHLAVGYDARINDRLNLASEISLGLWSVSSNSDENFSGTSGLSYGAKLFAYYNLLPEFSAGIFSGYKVFSSSKKNFLQGLEIGLSFRYNFTKGLFSTSDISFEDAEIDNIFPVFYSFYSENSFGLVYFKNNEKNDITDVEVSLFIESYMSQPEVCGSADRIKQGDSFSVELTAFLNENILLNLEASKTDAKITIKYKSLGRRIEKSQALEIQVLNRNNMTWEDDRRAAAFISPRDGAAKFFANHVKSAIRDNISKSQGENEQIARAIFSALKLYGINYVIDASSSFTDNIGTAQIDSLNFPYQTLLYHGGDCDDLTILNCALLESLGIDTALITVPGHIFMAFDSGIKAENADEKDYIIKNGKAWLPIEITLCQDTWQDEKNYAIKEWKKYPEERAIYPLSAAWYTYKPIGIPDSNIPIEVPSKQAILKAFLESK